MEKIIFLKRLLNYYNLDGYIVPKNDEFFSEYVPENNDKLKLINNFLDLMVLHLILKKKLFIC